MPLPTDLSDLQLDVLRVLWKRGEATASEVQASLEAERGLALTTVSTILSRLEKRKVVGHRTQGRQFVYRALIDEAAVRRSKVGVLVDSVFRGDPTALVGQLLEARDWSPGDLERIRAMIEQARTSRGKTGGS